jgi:uncharacterized membrane protein YdjX (TVP38/TMEM64 family)
MFRGFRPLDSDSSIIARSRAGRSNWLKISMMAVVLSAAIAGLGHGMEIKSWLEAGILRLRSAGPWYFFIGMALLPAVGFPLMPFTFAAGPVFGPTMGVGNVIACALAAVMVNVALSYWLATRAVRPLVARLASLLGYCLPETGARSAWQVTTIVRLAPGLPFFMQSYLLGLVRTPFVIYMIVSTLVPAGYLVAVILFGDALWSGKVKNALLAASLLGIVAGLIHLLRRRQIAAAVKSLTPTGTPNQLP